jgi:hypothetical protein
MNLSRKKKKIKVERVGQRLGGKNCHIAEGGKSFLEGEGGRKKRFTDRCASNRQLGALRCCGEVSIFSYFLDVWKLSRNSTNNTEYMYNAGSRGAGAAELQRVHHLSA